MEKTIKEIDEIIQRVNTHPEYSQLIKKRYLAWIREEAHKNSIEIGLLREEEKSPKTREYQERLRRVCAARDYLYTEGISPLSISSLGKIVEPEKNLVGAFRLSEVTFGKEMFEPPAPQKLFSMMEDLSYQLNENKDLHPVLTAANAHLSIIQIQPFMDGNKRVARLVQNYCLERKGYPPIIIPEEEAELYIQIRNNAIKDRYAKTSTPFNPSNSEETFNEYILARELTSVRGLERELASHRNYSIQLGNVKDRGIVRTITNSLRSEMKIISPEGSTFSEKTLGGKDYEIVYKGKVESSAIKYALEKLSKKYHFNWNIKYN